jgi:hypothetical protein
MPGLFRVDISPKTNQAFFFGLDLGVEIAATISRKFMNFKGSCQENSRIDLEGEIGVVSKRNRINFEGCVSRTAGLI